MDRKADDEKNQGHRKADQVVPDLQHRALEMTLTGSRIDEFGGLTEQGVGPGGIDQRIDFTAPHDRPGEDGLP